MNKDKKRCISPHKFNRVMNMEYNLPDIRDFVFNPGVNGRLIGNFIYWQKGEFFYRERLK